MVLSFSCSTPVPASSGLTHAQLWAGLQAKARNEVGFIGIIKKCEVISENKAKNSFLRRAETEMPNPEGGVVKKVMFEEITEYAPVYVHSRVLDNSTIITNTISTDVATGELVLTFTFHWDTGAPAGSEEELAKGKPVEAFAKSGQGLYETIEKIKSLVAEGVIPK